MLALLNPQVRAKVNHVWEDAAIVITVEGLPQLGFQNKGLGGRANNPLQDPPALKASGRLRQRAKQEHEPLLYLVELLIYRTLLDWHCLLSKQ